MSQSNQILYDADKVHFQYQLGHQRIEALREVTFQIKAGDLVCLSGPSGSGKSTLLNLLGLIEPMQTGNIFFQGHSLKKLNENQKNQLRKFELGFIFQHFHLFPVLTAEENIEYFLFRQGLPKKERVLRAKKSLESVGLWSHRHKKPLEMSGGQRQRIAIARALAKHPKVILADEPTASLDQKTGAEIMSLFLQANQERGTTLIVSSHDPMVVNYCKNKINLRDGLTVVQQESHHVSTSCH